MKAIFATKNNGKVNQLKEIIKLCKMDLEIESEKDVGFNEKVEETGMTFEENSKIKASSLKKYCDKNNVEYDFVLSDDSGLCVDKLNGMPGVFSDRWAGENTTNNEKLDFLLEKMKDYKEDKDRKAMFVSVITAIFKDGKVIQTRGECIGHIADHYNLIDRLTYNPVFIPEGFNKPIGEMDEEEFGRVHNHREIAIRKLMEKIQKTHQE